MYITPRELKPQPSHCEPVFLKCKQGPIPEPQRKRQQLFLNALASSYQAEKASEWMHTGCTRPFAGRPASFRPQPWEMGKQGSQVTLRNLRTGDTTRTGNRQPGTPEADKSNTARASWAARPGVTGAPPPPPARPSGPAPQRIWANFPRQRLLPPIPYPGHAVCGRHPGPFRAHWTAPRSGVGKPRATARAHRPRPGCPH